MSFAESSHDGHGFDHKVSLRERLTHFTWSWFECTMSTGAIATLLSQQPYTFTGLITIGKIFFVLDLVLFLAFSALITTRFIMKPVTFTQSLHHPHESFFFGTFWVSIALILYCTQQYGVPACGPWLIKALEVPFWTYSGFALLVVVFQYHVLFDMENLPVTDAMPAWILPAYPFLVLGPLAAVLEYNQPPGPALNILIGGIVFQGLGWTIAFFMYTLYFTRLINSPLPEESKRPGMYVAVGPAGESAVAPSRVLAANHVISAYTSNTLVAIGVQAQSVLPPGFLGITSISAGDVWKAFGVPCGIFLWLVGFWFSAVATVSVISGMRKMHFTLNYWGVIFPNAGLTIALIQIANVLDSDGIRGVCSAMTIILVAAWLVVALLHVKAVWDRSILWPGMDEDMEDVGGHQLEDADSKDD